VNPVNPRLLALTLAALAASCGGAEVPRETEKRLLPSFRI
jgi:hypothetical protein